MASSCRPRDEGVAVSFFLKAFRACDNHHTCFQVTEVLSSTNLPKGKTVGGHIEKGGAKE